jgi:glutaredoxin 3
MHRNDTSTRRLGAAGLCALTASLILSLGCGSAEESSVLSATRDLVARLGAGLTPGSADEADEDAAQLADARRDESSAMDSAAGAGEAILIEGGEASELTEAEGESDGSALYSYTDSQGSAHMVRGLHKVPRPHRGRAISLSGGNAPVINRYESTVVLASRRTVTARQPDYNPNREEVTLFSASWCGACRKAKNFLDQEGVTYEERDIDLDPAAKNEVRRVLGSVRIPLLDINGQYVSGYDPKAIRRLLRGS